MNSTANINIGDYATPFAFGPKRKGFKDIMLRDGKKIISQSVNLDQETRGKINKLVIQGLFDVKLNENIDPSQLSLKKCLKETFELIGSGMDKVSAINESLKRNLNQR